MTKILNKKNNHKLIKNVKRIGNCKIIPNKTNFQTKTNLKVKNISFIKIMKLKIPKIKTQ